MRERVDIDVEDACLDCTTRADVLQTLERLAAEHRYEAIISQLPATIEAMQMCRALQGGSRIAPHAKLSASVVALEGTTACGDLVGSDYLCEQNLPVRDDDERGVGETASAMVECADTVICPDRGPREDALGRADVVCWKSCRQSRLHARR